MTREFKVCHCRLGVAGIACSIVIAICLVLIRDVWAIVLGVCNAITVGVYVQTTTAAAFIASRTTATAFVAG